MNDTEALKAVADRQAITDLIYRYCRSMDRIDAELGYTIWHENAVVDYGEEVYRGSGRGFIDFVCGQHRHLLTHTHQVTNIIIELDGNRAGSESYVTATLRMMQGNQLKQITNWGRYVDQWSCRDGRWGIDKRVAIRDFDEIRDVTAMNNLDRGRRDRSDPSYATLRGPR
ncbi:MAG: nuclear transport factor 2 family protein [Rhodospirillaceae bacterium]|nr:MAG: nuclear transport factor 2 family protein [Rhodospirillaceae bacterium]